MTCGIYQIKNLINGKIYIGSSRVIEKRYGDHRSALRRNGHCNIFLQRAFNIDGEKNFELSVLYECPPDDLVFQEQRLLDEHRSYEDEYGYNLKKIAESVATHGMTRSREYKSWLHMRARCYTPTAEGYEAVGGRGIKPCPQWSDFAVFRADMGERPKGHILSRKDLSLNFDKGNCEWVTKRDVLIRASHVKKVIVGGREMILADAQRLLGVGSGAVNRRIKNFGDSIQQAVDHFSRRRNTRVKLFGVTIRCIEAERRLGVFQGALNNRRRHHKETFHEAVEFYLQQSDQPYINASRALIARTLARAKEISG